MTWLARKFLISVVSVPKKACDSCDESRKSRRFLGNGVKNMKIFAYLR